LLVVSDPDRCEIPLNNLRQTWQMEQAYVLLIIDAEAANRLIDLDQIDDVMTTDYTPAELSI
jgi:hypothetical protein